MITVTLLQPIGAQTSTLNVISTSTTGANSALAYDVTGYETVVIHLTADVSFPGGAVVSAQCSNVAGQWSDFPGGAVTYTALGVQKAIDVSGLKYLRVAVTTLSGSANITPYVTGVKYA